MDYLCYSSCPAQGRLSFLLDTMLQFDDSGGSPASALEILYELFLEIYPRADGVLREVLEPGTSRPFQHHCEVTGTNSFAGLQHIHVEVVAFDPNRRVHVGCVVWNLTRSLEIWGQACVLQSRHQT